MHHSFFLYIYSVTTNVFKICLCLWPRFLNVLMKFKGQCKVREGKKGKLRRARKKSTMAVLGT